MFLFSKAISTAICTLLRPLVRILLRHNIPFPTFVELAKWVYVDVAGQDFAISGKKQSVSRVALLTGLTRKEVLRLNRQSSPIDQAALERHNRATRVISGWVRDPAFHLAGGEPAPLHLGDGSPSFTELTRAHSGDIPSRAVLDELLRLGVVRLTDDGYVALVSRANIPAQGLEDKLTILGTDTADLITTIDHNIHCPVGDAPNFQRKVCYYSFQASDIPAFKQLVAAKAQPLLEEFDNWLAEHEQAASTPDQPRRRVGVSIFYFDSEPVEEEAAP